MTTPTRAFGREISGNRRVNNELSNDTRIAIITVRNYGVSSARLASDFGCSPRTVFNTTRRYTERQNTASRPRNGAPSKLTAATKRRILRIVRREPFTKYHELLGLIPEDVSRKTVYRLLSEHRITNWIAKKRPKPSEEHAYRRLRWAQQHVDWTPEQWRNVVFSDECSLDRGTGNDRRWVWRTRSQKWDRDKLIAKRTGKDLCQMFWGAIWGRGCRTELVALTRDENAASRGYSARSYIETLEEGFMGHYEPGMAFVQDNAPIHTAGIVRDWLENHGIWVLEWPPYSPDLNPIEHIWWALKKKIHELHPELEHQGDTQQALDNLITAAKEAWSQIGDGVMEGVLGSMRNRCEAVIAAEGWQTKY